jgi:hypothetical protein
VPLNAEKSLTAARDRLRLGVYISLCRHIKRHLDPALPFRGGCCCGLGGGGAGGRSSCSGLPATLEGGLGPALKCWWLLARLGIVLVGLPAADSREQMSTGTLLTAQSQYCGVSRTALQAAKANECWLPLAHCCWHSCFCLLKPQGHPRQPLAAQSCRHIYSPPTKRLLYYPPAFRATAHTPRPSLTSAASHA